MEIILRLIFKLKIQSYFSFTLNKVINGMGFKIPFIQGLGYNNLKISEEIVPSYKRILNLNDGVVLDIGGNIGQSLLLLKSVDMERPCFVFEPNSTCIFYLEKLLNKNQLGPVEIIPAGISTKNAIMQLNMFSDQTDDSSASIATDFRPNSNIKHKKHILTINQDLIDQLNIPRVGLIKIDVEGHESEVLMALENIISKDHPIIICEIWPAYQVENRIEKQTEITKLLTRNNYNIFSVSDEIKRNITEDGIINRENKKEIDFLFVPDEYLNQFDSNS